MQYKYPETLILQSLLDIEKGSQKNTEFMTFVIREAVKQLFLSDLSPIIGYACHSLTP